MECKPEVLKHVPLFSLLDEEELKFLAGQVVLQEYRPQQSELDHSVSRRAEAEILRSSRKLNSIGEQMGDIEEMLRNEAASRPN